jgi:predicted MFS family arabinose efflux permease
VTLTGIELFTFYFPVYGRSIGSAPRPSGMVMASYAVAAFIVRLGMHKAAQRLGEVGVLTASLFVSGATYMLVPLVSQAPLLALVAFCSGWARLRAAAHDPPHLQSRAAGRSGEALGLRLTVEQAHADRGPVVFGGLGSAFGLDPGLLGQRRVPARGRIRLARGAALRRA